MRRQAKTAAARRTVARSRARLIRLSPRKVRKVVDLIRGKDVTEALALLDFVGTRAAPVVRKVVWNARANATGEPFNLDEDLLYISRAWVDEGLTIPRIRPRAQGRAYRIRKRTSHITIEVREREE